MSNLKSIFTFLLGFLLFGCQGGTVAYPPPEGDPSCQPAVCEISMSEVLTEVAANANFTTGITVPSNGEAPSIWSLVMRNQMQQSADRDQWLKGWLPNTPSLKVDIIAGLNVTAGGWTLSHATNRFWWFNNTVNRGLSFHLSGLPVGRKITGLTAYYQNSNNTTQPVQTPSKIELYRAPVSTGTDFFGSTVAVLVGTQSDPETSQPAYILAHKIQLTGLSQTIVEDEEYYAIFTSESGTNSQAGGILFGLRVHLAY